MPSTWKDIVAHPYFSGKTDEEKLRIAENYFSKNFDANPTFKEKAEKDPEYRPRVWKNFVSKAVPPERWPEKPSVFVEDVKSTAAANVAVVKDLLTSTAEGPTPEESVATAGSGTEPVEVAKGFGRLGYETFTFIPRIIPAGLAGIQDLIAKGPEEAKKTIEQGLAAASSETVFGEMGNVERAILEVATSPFKAPEAATEYLREQFPDLAESPVASTIIQTGLEMAMILGPFRGVIRRGIQQSRLYRLKTVAEWPKEEVAKILGSVEERATVDPALDDAFSRLSGPEKVAALKDAGIKIEEVSPSTLGRTLGAKGDGRRVSPGRGVPGEAPPADRGGVLPEFTETGVLPEIPEGDPATQIMREAIAETDPAKEARSSFANLMREGARIVGEPPPVEPPPAVIPPSAAEPAPPSLPAGEVRPAGEAKPNLVVAIKTKSGTIIVGERGETHGGLVNRSINKHAETLQEGGWEDGWVDRDTGEYLTREEAIKKAKYVPATIELGKLHSIDIDRAEARPAIKPVAEGSVAGEEAIRSQIDDLSLAMMSWEPPQLIVDEATGAVKGRTKSTYPKWFKQVFPNDSLTIVMSAIQKWKIGGDEVLGKKEARIIRTLKDMATDAEAAGENLGQESLRSVFSAEFRLAGAVDDIIGDVVPSAGLSIRPADVVIGKPGYTEADYRFGNEESESRYVAAHGVPKQPLTERARVFLSSLRKKATREYEHIPRTAEFAPLRTALLKLARQKGVSSDRVVRAMQGITIRMDKTRMGLFERKVLLDDLAYEVERGHGLPFGFDSETLKVEHSKISGLTEKDPVVSDALAKRKEFNDSVRHDYIKAMKDIGVDVSRKFGNEKYFRHQVLEYANLRGISGAGKKLKTPDSRGFLKRRSGSTRDINTNYLEAEYEVFAQLLHDIEVAETIRVVDEDYNAIDTLKAEAKKQGVEWQEVIPDGYRLWQPKQGNVFYMADTIPAKLAEKLRDGILEEIGITEEDVSKVLAVGGKRRQFVVKNEVADTLENMVKIRPASVLLNMDKKALKGWKVWQLISPRRFLKYNFRNLTGDADAAFVGNPSVFKKVPQSARELYQVFAADKGMTPEMREWFKRGGFETTLQAQEMGEINKLRIFEHIRKEKEPIANLPARAFKAYWRKARLATDFRESVLRYAAYLDYLEQRTSGKLKNYGASIPEEINAIKDHRDAAFTMSNHLLGAYDQVSVMGRSLREHIFPFWSWKEVNFKRYIQLAKNAAANDGLAEAVGRKALGTLAKSPYTAWRVGKFILSATAFWSMLQAWNHLMFPDEEDELDVNTRNRPHIILGRNKDGKIINFTNLGALGDFLSWFGLDAAPLHVSNWFQGKRTLKEIATEMAQSPVNVVVQGTSPLIRMPAELLTKKSLFPDAFRPTMIRDRGYFMAKSVGLENEYVAFAGLPSEGYNKSLMNFFVYTSDPGRNAYGDILSEKYRFLHKINKGGEGSFMSPKSNALYNFKLAVRFGDEDAKKKYLTEYVKMGGTAKGMSASLQNMSPLSGLTRQEQIFFISQLTGEDKKKLVRAMHFYANVLLGRQKQKGE